jgi:hypothetical protein
MYEVNMVIKLKDIYKPNSLSLVIASIKEINSSEIGIVNATKSAYAVSMGDCPN